MRVPGAGPSAALGSKLERKRRGRACVVGLILGVFVSACGEGAPGAWSDDVYRDVMAYCRATDPDIPCADLIAYVQDSGCPIEAAYAAADTGADNETDVMRAIEAACPERVKQASGPPLVSTTSTSTLATTTTTTPPTTTTIPLTELDHVSDWIGVPYVIADDGPVPVPPDAYLVELEFIWGDAGVMLATNEWDGLDIIAEKLADASGTEYLAVSEVVDDLDAENVYVFRDVIELPRPPPEIVLLGAGCFYESGIEVSYAGLFPAAGYVEPAPPPHSEFATKPTLMWVYDGLTERITKVSLGDTVVICPP